MKLGGAAVSFSLVPGCLDFGDGVPSGETTGYADWISVEDYGGTAVLAVGVDRTSALSEELSGRQAGLDAEGTLVEYAVGNAVLALVSAEMSSSSLSGFLTRSDGSGIEGVSLQDVYSVNSELVVFMGSFELDAVGAQVEERGYSRASDEESSSYSGYRFYSGGEEGGVAVGVSQDSVLVSTVSPAMESVKNAVDAHTGSNALVGEDEQFGEVASLLPNNSLDTSLYLDQPRSLQEVFSVSVEPSGAVHGMSTNAGLVESDLEVSLGILYSGGDVVDGESALGSLASGADEVSVTVRGREAVVEAVYESVV